MKTFVSALLILLMTSVSAQADIVFGVIPLQDKDVMTKKFSALTDYLTKQLGEKVTLQIGNSYEEIEAGIREGSIQVAYMGPAGAIKANQRNHAVLPLVKVVKKGKPFYKSYVIAKKDSPLKTPADCKGKVFAFGDKGSTSSYLGPFKWKVLINVDEKEFYQIQNDFIKTFAIALIVCVVLSTLIGIFVGESFTAHSTAQYLFLRI